MPSLQLFRWMPPIDLKWSNLDSHVKREIGDFDDGVSLYVAEAVYRFLRDEGEIFDSKECTDIWMRVTGCVWRCMRPMMMQCDKTFGVNIVEYVKRVLLPSFAYQRWKHEAVLILMRACYRHRTTQSKKPGGINGQIIIDMLPSKLTNPNFAQHAAAFGLACEKEVRQLAARKTELMSGKDLEYTRGFPVVVKAKDGAEHFKRKQVYTFQAHENHTFLPSLPNVEARDTMIFLMVEMVLFLLDNAEAAGVTLHYSWYIQCFTFLYCVMSDKTTMTFKRMTACHFVTLMDKHPMLYNVFLKHTLQRYMNEPGCCLSQCEQFRATPGHNEWQAAVRRFTERMFRDLAMKQAATWQTDWCSSSTAVAYLELCEVLKQSRGSLVLSTNFFGFHTETAYLHALVCPPLATENAKKINYTNTVMTEHLPLIQHLQEYYHPYYVRDSETEGDCHSDNNMDDVDDRTDLVRSRSAAEDYYLGTISYNRESNLPNSSGATTDKYRTKDEQLILAQHLFALYRYVSDIRDNLSLYWMYRKHQSLRLPHREVYERTIDGLCRFAQRITSDEYDDSQYNRVWKEARKLAAYGFGKKQQALDVSHPLLQIQFSCDILMMAIVFETTETKIELQQMVYSILIAYYSNRYLDSAVATRLRRAAETDLNGAWCVYALFHAAKCVTNFKVMPLPFSVTRNQLNALWHRMFAEQDRNEQRIQRKRGMKKRKTRKSTKTNKTKIGPNSFTRRTRKHQQNDDNDDGEWGDNDDHYNEVGEEEVEEEEEEEEEDHDVTEEEEDEWSEDDARCDEREKEKGSLTNGPDQEQYVPVRMPFDIDLFAFCPNCTGRHVVVVPAYPVPSSQRKIPSAPITTHYLTPIMTFDYVNNVSMGEARQKVNRYCSRGTGKHTLRCNSVQLTSLHLSGSMLQLSPSYFVTICSRCGMPCQVHPDITVFYGTGFILCLSCSAHFHAASVSVQKRVQFSKL
jgi:hypothetical protein